jgi:serine phosphatase RsbU (regulator of sigma subunit)
MSDVNDLKDNILRNQKVIDELNRKTREVTIIQEISAEINSILDLPSILASILQSLDRVFQFKHSMILLPDDAGETMKVTASHGYEEKGIGAEVKMGEGVIGVVASRKRIMRMGNIGARLAYSSAVRNQFEEAEKKSGFKEKVKLPGLSNLQSQVAIPLLVKDRLIGVLAVESELSNVFDERDELIITIIANQAASAIENARLYEAEKARIIELNKVNQDLKKLNEQLEAKVEERTAEIFRQKELVVEKNREILSSIEYAKRIQTAILPSKKYIEAHLKEHFIFYRPKDIVSGDFYWVNKKENRVFVAAIDCTGHGVPGAFMSIVAHANLQRAIHVFNLRSTSEILDLLNETLAEGFMSNGQGIRDGMDIALCAIDLGKMEMEFSGANSSIYILNPERTVWPAHFVPFGDEMPGAEIRGDKQPVGFFENSKKFTSRSIQLQKGDLIYLFSDGYADQFGGAKGKKYMKLRFKELISSIYNQPMDKQEKFLEQAHHYWKGDLEQVDDILVMGIKI